MKNKTIILGKSGSGKSFLAMKEALKKKGFVAIFNGLSILKRVIQDISRN